MSHIMNILVNRPFLNIQTSLVLSHRRLLGKSECSPGFATARIDKQQETQTFFQPVRSNPSARLQIANRAGHTLIFIFQMYIHDIIPLSESED